MQLSRAKSRFAKVPINIGKSPNGRRLSVLDLARRERAAKVRHTGKMYRYPDGAMQTMTLSGDPENLSESRANFYSQFLYKLLSIAYAALVINSINKKQGVSGQ